MDFLIPNDPEWSVLAGMLKDAGAAARMVTRLRQSDFSSTQNALIFQAMSELVKGGGAVERPALVHKLEGAVDFHTLDDLFRNAVTAANINYWASEILKKSKLRQLSDIANQMQFKLSDNMADPETVLRDTFSSMQKINFREEDNFNLEDPTIRVLDEIEQVLRGTYVRNALLSGYELFDKLTGGFVPGQLIVVAGLTSMGKTAFALNLGRSIATKHRVHIISMEMSKYELNKRFLSAASTVPINAILKYGQKPGTKEILAIKEAGEKICNQNLTISDSSDVSILDVTSLVAGFKLQEKPLELLIIDYLQLMNMPGADTQNLRVAETTRELKNLATEYGVPIIVLSQLSRTASREKRKPALHDLRDSGSIEQDADMVMFVHRDKDADDYEKRKMTSVHIAKNRDGAIGTIPFVFDLDTQRIYPQEDEKPEEVVF
jgi:replicative DNA helicase